MDATSKPVAASTGEQKAALVISGAVLALSGAAWSFAYSRDAINWLLAGTVFYLFAGLAALSFGAAPRNGYFQLFPAILTGAVAAIVGALITAARDERIGENEKVSDKVRLNTSLFANELLITILLFMLLVVYAIQYREGTREAEAEAVPPSQSVARRGPNYPPLQYRR